MIGLYYPFIHFRDENWLKLALIYWSKIARIVPETYKSRDSDDVRRVQAELDVFVNSHPYYYGAEIANDFIAFVIKHAEQLRTKYDVGHADSWDVDKYTMARAPRGTDPRFGYIYHEKIGPSLRRLLVEQRLAVLGEGQDMRWIGVHPEIADVYMTSLAEAIAERSGYNLLADDLVRHTVVGERSIARLSAMLLQMPFNETVQDLISPETIALIAIQTILPRNLAAVPMNKIIDLRKKYPSELADFQDWIHSAAKLLSESTGGVTSPDAMKEHLSVLSEQKIKPRLKELKKLLRSLSIETVTSSLSLKSPWNIAGGTAAYYLSQPALAVGGIALTAIPTIGKQQREAQKAITGNPMAYLLHVQERLAPRSLLSKISTMWRKLSIGI